jgi:hypothetical protein
MNYHQALTATATGTITWYDAATAENIVTTQLKLVKEPKLIMQASDGTCFSSTRTAVTLTINPAPAAQSRTIKICSDGTTTQTLTATATGGTITWYDAATAGNVVTTPTQVWCWNQTYYAQASNGTCSSVTRKVVLTINAV